jgi:hypothetical protein
MLTTAKRNATQIPGFAMRKLPATGVTTSGQAWLVDRFGGKQQPTACASVTKKISHSCGRATLSRAELDPELAGSVGIAADRFDERRYLLGAASTSDIVTARYYRSPGLGRFVGVGRNDPGRFVVTRAAAVEEQGH